MIRNFARINSMPHYPVDYTDNVSSPPESNIRRARDIPLEIPNVIPQIISPDNIYGAVPMPKASSFINPHDEYQYLNLIHEIIQQNQKHTSRNGDTLSAFGAAMVFSLEQGTIPIFTTKQMAWKTCLKELLWFIQGKTDNSLLQSAGVHIWDDNASRDFLDSRGLTQHAEGDLGPIYGHQWRHFNANYETHETDYTGKGIDQLEYIIKSLKDPVERFSRRLVMSAWNPCQLDKMALPPCHVLCQFNVDKKNRLSCALYQRSGDIGLGVPFNIASYSFLTHILAKHCGLIPHEFIYYLGNAHIYDDHVESLKPQLLRRPFSFPRVEISVLRENINDYTFNDFKVLDYQSHDPIPMKMRK
jgi:thymidylate synthase